MEEGRPLETVKYAASFHPHGVSTEVCSVSVSLNSSAELDFYVFIMLAHIKSASGVVCRREKLFQFRIHKKFNP